MIIVKKNRENKKIQSKSMKEWPFPTYILGEVNSIHRALDFFSEYRFWLSVCVVFRSKDSEQTKICIIFIGEIPVVDNLLA